MFAPPDDGAWRRPDALKTRPLRPEEDAAWDALVQRDPLARAIVPRWDVLAGWRESRLGAFRAGALVGGLTVAVRRIPRTPFSLGRITNALLGPARPGEVLAALLEAVERESRRHRIIETEVRLRIPERDALDGFDQAREVTRVLLDFGYHPLSKVDTTYVVRIDRSDEALINSFDRSVRNKIRKAERAGFELGRSTDRELVELLYESYVEMSARKGAPVPVRALVAEGLEPLLARGHAVLFTERYEGRVSCIAVADMLGVPCYVLGARTPANVRGELPGAAQALHFAIMRALRDQGKKFYDLGGCEGPVPVEGHPNYGVWSFKQKFHGAFVRFIPYYRRNRGPTRAVLDVVHRLRGDFL